MSDYPRFARAVEQFQHFLATQQAPTHVRWLLRGDVYVMSATEVFVCADAPSRVASAAAAYDEARGRSFGVCLYALLTMGTETGCYLFAPTDDLQAQYALMGNGLELSMRTPLLTARLVLGALWAQHTRREAYQRFQLTDNDLPVSYGRAAQPAG